MRIRILQLKKTAFAALFVMLLIVVGVTKGFAQTFTVGNLNYSVNDDGVSVTVTGFSYGGESFENGLPSDWAMIDADGDGFNWMRASAYTYTDLTNQGHNDSYDYLISQSYNNGNSGALTPDNYLVSNIMAFTEHSIVHFYACAKSDIYSAEHFGVAISTSSQTDASCFTTIAEWTLSAKGNRVLNGTRGNRVSGSWYEYTVDLSDYAGQSGYVAIRHFDCTDNWIIAVDDVFIGDLIEELIIPESIDYNGVSYAVTSIGQNAFYNCTNFTGDLVIPNSVTTISDCAFANCTGFSTLTIGTGLRQWDTGNGFYYANSPFYNCTGITTINYNATYYDGMLCVNSDEWDCYNMQSIFSTCTSLTTINIGENVQSIPTAAFKHTNVNTVNFNATNCNSMGGYYCTEQYVFEACEQLTTINIGENVQTIPSNAFRGCSSLTSVVFSESITTIGESAFYGCSGLTGALNIPNSVTTIGGSAFDGCTGFSGTLTIGIAVTSIGDYAFANCTGLTGDLVIPNMVASVGKAAFANCTGFTSLTIGTGVEIIGNSNNWSHSSYENPFYNCSGITTLYFNAVDCYYIPIEWNGDALSPFAYLSSLTTLNIGTSVQKLPPFAFDGCTSISGTLNIPNSVTSIGAEAFRNCSGLTGTITIPESVTSIGGGAFDGCSNLGGTLTIGPNITHVGPRSFAYTGIETVNFNATSCEDIGDYYVINPTPTYYSSKSRYGFAFEGCENFTTLNIGNGVERIPESAFSSCSSLSGELTIPNSVTYIGSRAFYDCNSLTGSLIIPNSVITILYGSFGNCSGLNGTLTLGEGLQSVCGNAFENTGFTAMNYNAVNCFVGNIWTDEYETYYYEQSLDLPSSLTTLVFGSSVESISRIAFKDCSSLTGVITLPNSLKSIGDQAFYNCYGLEGIVMGNSVEIIGTEAFRNCGGLRGELTLPETLQSVGNYAFASCDELTTINYNAINCTAMGNAQQPVFYDCASVAHINIGENVESIPNYAFKRCSTVVDMTVAATAPPTIGSSTFGTVSRSIPVTVQCSATPAFQAAQYWSEFTNYAENFNYVLQVAASDPTKGTVVVSKEASCDDPTAMVTAYPELGYAFTGWSENGTMVSQANPYSFLMESSRSLQAEFAPGVSYSVAVALNPAIAGSVTGMGNYNDGSAVSLIATANPGYAFVNWTENGTVVSSDETYTFTIHENHNFVANFTPYAYHWDVNIHQYPNNMTAIGIIQIEGVEQATPTLEIGAFCGDECRGRQLLTYYPQVNRYLVFLMLHGNDNDELRFKLYDHGLAEELELSCTSMVTFVTNGRLGTPANPYVFNFINSQQTEMSEGWTWYSTYIEQSDIEGLQMMTEGLGENGVMIKSQTGFIANSGGEWMGNLDAITNESMYMVNTTAAGMLEMVGNSAIASQHPITLNQGWNWIGYPLATANDVNVALSGLDAHDNDMLKSQEAFTTYYDGFGWMGSLNTITPGMGLMYESNNSGAVSFTYTEGRSGVLKRNVTAENNHWIPNMHKYTNNMNVMAVVELDDVELRDGRYELAVFAGEECRGSVRLMYVEPVDRYVAFLTITGHETTDLRFALFDSDEAVEYGNAKEHLVFESDVVVGNTKDMFTVHFYSQSQSYDFDQVAVYPNPADCGQNFRIAMSVGYEQNVRVEIINELGAVVSVVRSNALPMELKAPAMPGVYTLKIVAEGHDVSIRKLVVK